MEAQRDDVLPFMLWEPFIWEYSSAIGTLLLFPALIWLLKVSPFDWQKIARSLLIYSLSSIVFSLSHIGVMVAIRKLVYTVQDMHYDFGLSWFELLYEYRKDLWGFLFLIVVIKTYQYIVSQLAGEAAPISQGEDTPKNATLDRLLVKKLGKEFIVRVAHIDWLESSGNYVNLHIGERIYPLRATLTQLSEQLEQQGFCRIHRSHAIRLDTVESITPLPSGDSEVKLTTGKVLNLSRRYKEPFKTYLNSTTTHF
jgi:DNA-binding LytR/AlgR family response regulator